MPQHRAHASQAGLSGPKAPVKRQAGGLGRAAAEPAGLPAGLPAYISGRAISHDELPIAIERLAQLERSLARLIGRRRLAISPARYCRRRKLLLPSPPARPPARPFRRRLHPAEYSAG